MSTVVGVAENHDDPTKVMLPVAAAGECQALPLWDIQLRMREGTCVLYTPSKADRVVLRSRYVCARDLDGWLLQVAEQVRH